MPKISQYPRWARWLSWIPVPTAPIVRFVMWMEFHEEFPGDDQEGESDGE